MKVIRFREEERIQQGRLRMHVIVSRNSRGRARQNLVREGKVFMVIESACEF